jgi:hypothetical protein
LTNLDKESLELTVDLSSSCQSLMGTASGRREEPLSVSVIIQETPGARRRCSNAFH